MAGIGILASYCREDDGQAALNIYPYRDCAYMQPSVGGVTKATDQARAPDGYKLVVVEAVGGDAWIVQGDTDVTAPPPSAGTGFGRYLAEGKEIPFAVPLGSGRAAAAYFAARAVVGSPTVYVYGVGQ